MDWVTAWSGKNVAAYLAAYVPDFKQGDKNHAVWKQQRTERISKPKTIEVALNNIKVNMLDDRHATVTFTQAYRSDDYRDQVEKTLKLEKQHERWLIVEERVLQ